MESQETLDSLEFARCDDMLKPFYGKMKSGGYKVKIPGERRVSTVAEETSEVDSLVDAVVVVADIKTEDVEAEEVKDITEEEKARVQEITTQLENAVKQVENLTLEVSTMKQRLTEVESFVSNLKDESARIISQNAKPIEKARRFKNQDKIDAARKKAQEMIFAEKKKKEAKAFASRLTEPPVRMDQLTVPEVPSGNKCIAVNCNRRRRKECAWFCCKTCCNKANNSCSVHGLF